MTISSPLNKSTMIEGAVCIVLAVTLSKLNIFALPQGGSIDLELVPLLFFSWRRGLKWGCCVGALTGLIRILVGGYIIDPLQAIVDYPVAYACTGFAALFSELNKGQIVGTMIAAMTQIACHTLSGAVFFAQYAPEGQNPWAYSVAYNSPIIVLKYAVSAVVAFFIANAIELGLQKKA